MVLIMARVASGSWADEMENLPSARQYCTFCYQNLTLISPCLAALKEGPEVHPSRRDDFLSSKRELFLTTLSCDFTTFFSGPCCTNPRRYPITDATSLYCFRGESRIRLGRK